MTAISTTNAASSAPAKNTATGAITKQLNEYDFLKILASELQNQDPTNPVDNKDFIAQLAQFSTLEMMQNMSTSFESLDQSMKTFIQDQSQAKQATLLSQTASLIGKRITAEADGNQIEGVVDSVSVKDSIPYLIIDGESVPVSSITQILSQPNEVQDVNNGGQNTSVLPDTTSVTG